jgi:hypothetical protein
MSQLAIDYPKSDLEAVCKRWHIRRLAIFGSVLRDDFGPDSDVDVLVEFEEGHTPGWEIVDIGEDLSSVFGGRYVDIVDPQFLIPGIKERVLASAVVQYEDHDGEG